MITYQTDKLQKVLLSGGCEQNGTPSPNTPMDIVCNNGVIKVNRNLYSTEYHDYQLSQVDGIEVRANDRVNVSGMVDCRTIKSFKITTISPQGGFRIFNYRVDNTFIDANSTANVGDIVTFGDNVGFFRIQYNYSGTGTGTENILIYNSAYNLNDIYTDGTVETVTATGKNLFDISASTLGGLSSTNGSETDSTARARTDFIDINTSRITVSIDANDNFGIVNSYYYDENKNYIGNIGPADPSGAIRNDTFTVPNGSRYVRVTFCVYNSPASGINIGTFRQSKIQIESGSTATAYEPYFNGGTATAEMLLSVNDYKDVQSVLDGVIARNVGIKVLDGTEDWDYQTQVSNVMTIKSVVFPADFYSNPNNNVGYCNYYTVVATSTSLSSVLSSGHMGWNTMGNIMFKWTLSGESGVASFKQFLADQYANGTPVIIVYPLATPTTEQVTPQALNGITASVTAGSIDNLPIESGTIEELKKRYIGDNEVGRVYIGSNKVWETPDWYGIRWREDTGVVERIGNADLHRSLPLQSQMRRCMVQDDGTVYKYISATNPLQYEDGTTANYDGTDGQVMVEIPSYYHESYQSVEDGVTWRYLKLFPDVRLGVTSPKCYMGAFELMQDSSNNSTAKGSSVSILDLSEMSITGNTTSINAADVKYLSGKTNYRNYNYSNTDSTSVKCSYGRATTNRSRATFRTIAANRGAKWSQQSWDAYCSMVRLYAVEYASFNSQTAYNASLTADGYKQGGLGDGVTTTDSSTWNTFNAYNSFIPCGVTISLGNNTGVIDYAFAANEFQSAAKTFSVPSYRGIENPFGHVWKFIDGLNRQGVTGNIEKIYVCHDVTKFAENAADGYELISESSARATGDFGGVSWDKTGTFWPKPGGSTSPYGDYFYNAYANDTWYTLCAGGRAPSGAAAGLLCFYAGIAAARASANVGSRLLYTPSTN